MSRATRRDWAALALLLLPVFTIAVDNTVLHLALPQIAQDLAPSAAQQLWIIDVYPLVLAGLLLIMGSLGDRIGRRRLLVIGSAGFSLVSLLAAFAPNAGLLIAARVLLGFFGAMLMPSTLGLLRSIFTDARQRTTAIAIWAATFSAGAAFGPAIGGLLIDLTGWWGAVFAMAVPILAPLVLLARVLIPEPPTHGNRSIDVVSAALSLATMGPLVLAIKQIATHGLGITPVTLIVAGLVAGAAFVARQHRLTDPMLDLSLFRDRRFSASLIVNALSMTALVGFNLLASQHLQLVDGLSAAKAALVQLPGALAAVIAGLLVVLVTRYLSIRTAVVAGTLVTLSGYLLTVWSGTSLTPVIIAAAFVAIGIGVGGAETLTNDTIISTAPPQRAGAAAAISEIAYEIGSLLGTAVIGGVLTAAYRTHLAVPSGVPDEAGAAAKETLGGAVHEAEQLGAPHGPTLLKAAQDAFESGVVVTAGVGVALMAIAAWTAWSGLRDIPTPTATQAEPRESEPTGVTG